MRERGCIDEKTTSRGPEQSFVLAVDDLPGEDCFLHHPEQVHVQVGGQLVLVLDTLPLHGE